MIRISQLKLKPGCSREQLEKKVCSLLHLKPEQIEKTVIVKQSIDARKKPEIWLSHVVDVKIRGLSEEKVLKRCRDKNIAIVSETIYHFPVRANACSREEKNVIVGMGPAGLFCAYKLAEAGFPVLLLERGQDVDTRTGEVEAFWKGGPLKPESNVQFGEGGAGTFSDGKLNTLVKDRDGRNREVLRILVENGAPERILYENKPHIGTDILSRVVKKMRERILQWGGQVRFGTRVTDLILERDRVCAVACGQEKIKADRVVLAIGHSARDTFEMLEKRGIPMEAKAFAVGLRVEHPQALINLTQYGTENSGELPPASYKLTAQTSENRGVYSFCMCPGGYVVNASSEPERLAVNGMSYSKRNGTNANSAVIVSVTPEDYGAVGPLAGIHFQRMLEERAWQLGMGKIPVQRYRDYARRPEQEKRDRYVKEDFMPQQKGDYVFTDLTSLLPDSLRRAFLEGMESFDRLIPGFADDAVCLSGVESRTSSPVRIPRDESFQSRVRGLYPCGEGAGYAGGITSAAMDGIRVAEAIAVSTTCVSRTFPIEL